MKRRDLLASAFTAAGILPSAFISSRPDSALLREIDRLDLLGNVAEGADQFAA